MKPLRIQPKDLKPGIRVHVEGWNFACQFVYEFTDPRGFHHIRTPKTNRKFTTANALWFTRRNQFAHKAALFREAS